MEPPPTSSSSLRAHYMSSVSGWSQLVLVPFAMICFGLYVWRCLSGRPAACSAQDCGPVEPQTPRSVGLADHLIQQADASPRCPHCGILCYSSPAEPTAESSNPDVDANGIDAWIHMEYVFEIQCKREASPSILAAHRNCIAVDMPVSSMLDLLTKGDIIAAVSPWFPYSVTSRRTAKENPIQLFLALGGMPGHSKLDPHRLGLRTTP
ncbi:hypothetical protein C8R47DRAFT_1076472 [Mycena vitilis]|nr:hypothetical protein C8R47DRAFT_1076472 [Mycena vitilis]